MVRVALHAVRHWSVFGVVGSSACDRSRLRQIDLRVPESLRRFEPVRSGDFCACSDAQRTRMGGPARHSHTRWRIHRGDGTRGYRDRRQDGDAHSRKAAPGADLRVRHGRSRCSRAERVQRAGCLLAARRVHVSRLAGSFEPRCFCGAIRDAPDRAGDRTGSKGPGHSSTDGERPPVLVGSR